MKNNELKGNSRFEDTTLGVVYNHFSFCEMVKHIMVKYGNISYKSADEKLKNHCLSKAPESLIEVVLITHELEFHWAMLIVHGDMYWTRGIPSDFNDFEDEYRAWEAEIRLQYKLKESCKYYDVDTKRTNS